MIKSIMQWHDDLTNGHGWQRLYDKYATKWLKDMNDTLSTQSKDCSVITTAAINQQNGLHISHVVQNAPNNLLQTDKNSRITNNK